MSSSAGVLARDGAAPTIVFGTESCQSLPRLGLGACSLQQLAGHTTLDVKLLSLPQPAGLDALKVEKVRYKHGGYEITALLCERAEPPLPAGAPLLVHAHGGPAIGVVCSQRMAADHWRYPYRHLLMAGFRVFQPLFRGTLGFGDRFAQANIGTQGSLDGDLGDILAGLDWLHKNPDSRLKGTISPERTGIFGGSYGGYMTIRAMASVSSRFAAGVAMYGFVHNRWMSYEGGDFTWEDEYIAPPPMDSAGVDIDIAGLDGEAEDDIVETKQRAFSEMSPAARLRAMSGMSTPASDVWPLPKEMEASDTFNGLHNITKPMLLMHGEKDDICPLSQSQVAFHMLEKQGVPTGLIIYPGEGHGFDEPDHQRDRDRRVLAWFMQHLRS